MYSNFQSNCRYFPIEKMLNPLKPSIFEAFEGIVVLLLTRIPGFLVAVGEGYFEL